MARLKTSKSSVKRTITIVLMGVASIALTAGIVFTLLKIRQSGYQLFTSTSERLTKEYTDMESLYVAAAKEITQDRKPINADALTSLATRYETLTNELHAQPLETSALPKLSAQIEKRSRDIVTLQNINALLMLEESVGSDVVAFNACIKAVSFTGSATKIYDNLSVCTTSLTSPQVKLLNIPHTVTLTCPPTETPAYVIQKIKETHFALMAYYQAVASKNAASASRTDQEYKIQSAALKKLPSWNVCITKTEIEQAKSIE